MGKYIIFKLAKAIVVSFIATVKFDIKMGKKLYKFIRNKRMNNAKAKSKEQLKQAVKDGKVVMLDKCRRNKRKIS